MFRQLFVGSFCALLASGTACNHSLIEPGQCTPGSRGCDPGGEDPRGGPNGPDRIDRVGPGQPSGFDPKGEGSSGVKLDDKGNVVLDPGNFATMTPIIWVANSGEGTISKVDTRTMKEVARYVTAPGGGADPSRTTVSLTGDVVVANRALLSRSNKASATKIAGDRSGCIDRNGNGRIDTSEGSGPGAAIPWPAGQMHSPDECVLWYTELGAGSVPRAAGFDAGVGELETHVYIGLWATREVVRLRGKDGAIVKRINVAPAQPYGLVLDLDGAVWVQGTGTLVKIDVKAGDQVKVLGSIPCPYGIAADSRGFIYTAGATCVSRYNPATGRWDQVDVPGATFLRGLALDQKHQVWVADTQVGMFHIDAMGANMVVKRSIPIGQADGSGNNVGAAIDFDGNPWVISYSESKAYKINPANYTTQAVEVGTTPYTYSDMTGFQLRNAGAPAGFFRRTFEGCGPHTRWFDLDWQIMAPPGTEVTVRVRFAKSPAELMNAMWVQVARVPPDQGPVRLQVPQGASPDYMQVEISMKSADPKLTPILSSLSASYSCNLG
ncbi:MAG: hypothetical protein RMK29_01670 [Myxococcales bacterium]|nr:hypothetical protein [Myxococcota bacterium]MDW8280388.1 hypothetical protein [Myxococcales bacterium]